MLTHQKDSGEKGEGEQKEKFGLVT